MPSPAQEQEMAARVAAEITPARVAARAREALSFVEAAAADARARVEAWSAAAAVAAEATPAASASAAASSALLTHGLFSASGAALSAFVCGPGAADSLTGSASGLGAPPVTPAFGPVAAAADALLPLGGADADDHPMQHQGDDDEPLVPPPASSSSLLDRLARVGSHRQRILALASAGAAAHRQGAGDEAASSEEEEGDDDGDDEEEEEEEEGGDDQEEGASLPGSAAAARMGDGASRGGHGGAASSCCSVAGSSSRPGPRRGRVHASHSSIADDVEGGGRGEGGAPPLQDPILPLHVLIALARGTLGVRPRADVSIPDELVSAEALAERRGASEAVHALVGLPLGSYGWLPVPLAFPEAVAAEYAPAAAPPPEDAAPGIIAVPPAPHRLVDAATGLVSARLSNGLTLTYRPARFEANTLSISVCARGGRLTEGEGGWAYGVVAQGAPCIVAPGTPGVVAPGTPDAPPRLSYGPLAPGGAVRGGAPLPLPLHVGACSVGLSALLASGAGGHSAETLERVCAAWGLSLSASVSGESLCVTAYCAFPPAAAEAAAGELQPPCASRLALSRALQLIHAYLAAGAWEPAAFTRVLEDSATSLRSAAKSLASVTSSEAMRHAFGEVAPAPPLPPQQPPQQPRAGGGRLPSFPLGGPLTTVFDDGTCVRPYPRRDTPLPASLRRGVSLEAARAAVELQLLVPSNLQARRWEGREGGLREGSIAPIPMSPPPIVHLQVVAVGDLDAADLEELALAYLGPLLQPGAAAAASSFSAAAAGGVAAGLARLHALALPSVLHATPPEAPAAPLPLLSPPPAHPRMPFVLPSPAEVAAAHAEAASGAPFEARPLALRWRAPFARAAATAPAPSRRVPVLLAGGVVRSGEAEARCSLLLVLPGPGKYALWGPPPPSPRAEAELAAPAVDAASGRVRRDHPLFHSRCAKLWGPAISTRVMRRLREDMGGCYAADADVLVPDYGHPGYVSVSATPLPAQLPAMLAAAVAVVAGVLSGAEPLTEEEFRAVAAPKPAEVATSLATSGAWESLAGSLHCHGSRRRLGHVHSLERWYRAVTREDVAASLEVRARPSEA